MRKINLFVGILLAGLAFSSQSGYAQSLTGKTAELENYTKWENCQGVVYRLAERGLEFNGAKPC